MHKHCFEYVCRALLVASVVLLASLASFLFWWSEHDYFDYNAIGTVSSVEYCKTYDKTEWASESIGRISVVFQLLGDNVTYENEIFTPAICSLHSCCKSLVGKQVYFQVKASEDGNYTAVDLSSGEVQNSGRWVASGVLLLVFSAACVGCLIISLADGSVQRKPVDEVELLEDTKDSTTAKLDEVD
jgi:hypothetical protein